MMRLQDICKNLYHSHISSNYMTCQIEIIKAISNKITDIKIIEQTVQIPLQVYEDLQVPDSCQYNLHVQQTSIYL